MSLLELVVALSILGLAYTVAAVAMTSLPNDAEGDVWRDRLSAGESAAIETGRPVVVWPDSSHLESPVLFLPDGRRIDKEAF